MAEQSTTKPAIEGSDPAPAWHQGLYSQHLTFLTTYKQAQKARELNCTKLECLVTYKRSSLLGSFKVIVNAIQGVVIVEQVFYPCHLSFEELMS